MTLEPETLIKLLRYEPCTGKLFWLDRDESWFKNGEQSSEHTMKVWNAGNAGREAFTANMHGYRTGSVLGKPYLAHRVIWAIENGNWPLEDIDHVNGIRDDNRISNLRSVSRAENMRNKKTPNTNKSGVVGVCWDKATKMWRSDIDVDGKRKLLGRYDNKQDAIDARLAAEVKYGYHENHGRET